MLISQLWGMTADKLPPELILSLQTDRKPTFTLEQPL
jgi:hypothetical protein